MGCLNMKEISNILKILNQNYFQTFVCIFMTYAGAKYKAL